jgi:hypothetical protein
MTMNKLFEIKDCDTTLETQIVFMQELNSIIKTPLSVSILNSLKELKGIKQNQLEKQKNK